jgi:uncharacterized protein YeaO (DUF488 family)
MSITFVQQFRGKKLPPNTKSVIRGSRWGNKHDWRILGREEAVARYRADIEAMSEEERRRWLKPLRGYQLACYCQADEVHCHAKILASYLAAA